MSLEIVSSYKYLGTLFSKSGSFLNNRKHLAQQAKKAMHLLYKRIHNLNLPIDLIFKLFDHTVLPILTYASEIWGYEDLKILERIHCEFLRKVLHLRTSTPLYMLYAESGRYPINITIKCRMIGFWNRLILGNKNKIAYKIYQYMINCQDFEFKWLSYIKSILSNTGRNDLWLNQTNIQSKTIKCVIKQVLLDQNYQMWHETLQNSSKGRNYSIYKENICLENYLLTLDKGDFINMIKFRTGNHFFPIEIGRWEGTDISERKCSLCSLNDIGDELHYLLKCTFFDDHRKKYINRYYYRNPNIIKFKMLLTNSSPMQLQKLCKFIKILLETIRR
jgi:hypothetical protein